MAMVGIEPIPLLGDNYAWLMIVPESRACVIVDPGDADPVLALLRRRGLSLAAILLTHHHGDHTGGVAGLVHRFPAARVVSSRYDAERIDGVTETVGEGSALELLGETVLCMETPGHTLGAVSYYWPAGAALFPGDTLFGAGCGRLFEGTIEQLFASLTRMAVLPPETRVYCGHEYTEKNLRFAHSLEPDNAVVKARLEEVQAMRRRGEPSVPSTLAAELATNPFLRASDPALQALLGARDALAAFSELRRRRDRY